MIFLIMCGLSIFGNSNYEVLKFDCFSAAQLDSDKGFDLLSSDDSKLISLFKISGNGDFTSETCSSIWLLMSGQGKLFFKQIENFDDKKIAALKKHLDTLTPSGSEIMVGFGQISFLMKQGLVKPDIIQSSADSRNYLFCFRKESSGGKLFALDCTTAISLEYEIAYIDEIYSLLNQHNRSTSVTVDPGLNVSLVSNACRQKFFSNLEVDFGNTIRSISAREVNNENKTVRFVLDRIYFEDGFASIRSGNYALYDPIRNVLVNHYVVSSDSKSSKNNIYYLTEIPLSLIVNKQKDNEKIVSEYDVNKHYFHLRELSFRKKGIESAFDLFKNAKESPLGEDFLVAFKDEMIDICFLGGGGRNLNDNLNVIAQKLMLLSLFFETRVELKILLPGGKLVQDKKGNFYQRIPPWEVKVVEYIEKYFEYFHRLSKWPAGKKIDSPKLSISYCSDSVDLVSVYFDLL